MIRDTRNDLLSPFLNDPDQLNDPVCPVEEKGFLLRRMVLIIVPEVSLLLMPSDRKLAWCPIVPPPACLLDCVLAAFVQKLPPWLLLGRLTFRQQGWLLF